jgi:hypothetical protein
MAKLPRKYSVTALGDGDTTFDKVSEYVSLWFDKNTRHWYTEIMSSTKTDPDALKLTEPEFNEYGEIAP